MLTNGSLEKLYQIVLVEAGILSISFPLVLAFYKIPTILIGENGILLISISITNKVDLLGHLYLVYISVYSPTILIHVHMYASNSWDFYILMITLCHIRCKYFPSLSLSFIYVVLQKGASDYVVIFCLIDIAIGTILDKAFPNPT